MSAGHAHARVNEKHPRELQELLANPSMRAMMARRYRDGIMAGDTLIADDEVRFPCHERKVHRLRDGSLIGLCGDLAQTQGFMRWVRRGMPGECPPFDKSDAMIVRPDRVFIFCEAGRF